MEQRTKGEAMRGPEPRCPECGLDLHYRQIWREGMGIMSEWYCDCGWEEE